MFFILFFRRCRFSVFKLQSKRGELGITNQVAFKIKCVFICYFHSLCLFHEFDFSDTKA